MADWKDGFGADMPLYGLRLVRGDCIRFRDIIEAEMKEMGEGR